MTYNVDVTSVTQSFDVSVSVEENVYKVDVKVGDSVESKFWAEQAQDYADQALVSSLEAGSFTSNALNSANAAAASELSASQSATTATTKANEASASASDALASQNSASASASTATIQAGIATTQAEIATNKANESIQSASNALASEQAATISETNASTSEQAAALSASNALSSANSASASASTATTQANNAATSASQALTSRNQAEGFRNQSQTILTDIQALLPNFPRPAVFALNKRAIEDSAIFGQKLKPTNDFLKAFDNLNPSLVMVPSAQRAGQLYSVLPEGGAGDFTVSRNGTATFLGADGLLQTAGVNVPRLEYNPDGTFKGVLVEPAATNLLLRSEEFENSYWSKNNSTIEITADTTPINNVFARKVVSIENPIFAPNIRRTGAFNNSTVSIFVKYIDVQYFCIQTNTNPVRRTYFNLIDGTIQTQSSSHTNVKITPINNGWFRCQVTDTQTFDFISLYITDLPNSLQVQSSFSGSTYYTGAQLETGSVATSYIPTFGSTVTRPADIITRTNAQDLIGQTEGTIYVDYDKILNNSTSRNIISLIDTSQNNLLEIWDGVSSNNLGMLVYLIRKNSVFVSTGFGQNTISPSGRYKLCLTYSETNYRFYVNGVRLRNDTFTSRQFSNPLNLIGIGNRNNTFPGSGNFRNAFLLKTQLSDAQAIALTTL